MDDPKAFARAVTRALGSSGSAPAGPAAAPNEDSWVIWAEGIIANLAESDQAFGAINRIFEAQEQRIEALEARIAELEKKPAARTVEHVRDSNGAVIRSVVLDG